MEKNKVGLISAIFLGVSSIIGSGSLFSPYKTAVIAGPGAIFSWLIAGGIILLLALCFAELAALYPKRGLSAIIPTLSHNKFFGFPFAIANWLGVVIVIGLEADATVQYLINLTPKFSPYFYINNQLTFYGNILSICFVLFYSLINYWGAAILVKANNILAILKIIIPLIIALTIIGFAFHPINFTLVNNQLIPYGFSSILTPILTSGILVSFNGFQVVASFSSEIKQSEKNILLALVIALVICLFIYILLQIAFIGAVPTAMLVNGGWSQLKFNAPMVELALLIGLHTFTSIIYFSSIITPSGSGVTAIGAAGRMFTAMSRNGQMPKFFAKINPVHNLSRRSLILNMSLAILFLLIFHSWSQLAEFLTLIHIISYLPIPLALCVFRNLQDHQAYPFRLFGGRVISALLFIILTYLVTLSALKTITEIFTLFLIFQIIFISLNVKSWPELRIAIKQGAGAFIYFTGIWIFIFLSPRQLTVWNAIPIIIFAILSFYALIKYQFNRDLTTDKASPLLLTYDSGL